MAHLVGRQKLRLLFCCRAGLRVRLQRALRYGKAAPFGVPGGRRRFAASAWPQNQTKGTGLMAPSPWFVRAARARRPPRWDAVRTSKEERGRRSQPYGRYGPTPTLPGLVGRLSGRLAAPGTDGIPPAEAGVEPIGSPAGSRQHIPGWLPDLPPCWITCSVGRRLCCHICVG